MSKRKFTSLPSVSRVTQGSRGMIWISPSTGVSRAPGHPQSWSPRTDNRGSKWRCLLTPSLRAIWTLPFPMPVLSAVGTVNASQSWWISKILFSSLLSFDSHSGRMNRVQDFSLLSGHVLHLPLYSSILLGFFCSLLAFYPGPY